MKSSNCFIFFFFFLFSLSSKTTVKASGWSYTDQPNWPNGENQCDGHSQSPIDIITSDAYFNQSLSIKFLNYEQPSLSYKCTNNGHSVQFDYIGDPTSAPMITGPAVFGQQFRLAQFHFHWGAAKHIGSEHKINGRAFPVELHLVHYHSKFDSLGAALEDGKDGNIAVVGVFFEIKTHNPGFDIIGQMIQTVQDSAESVTLSEPVILKYLLPESIEKLFRYHGSLTTPPCAEGLIWLVLDTPNKIGFDQFKKFLGVIDPHNGEKLVNNFRKLQPLNGRKVESSWDAMENVNKGFVVHSQNSHIITLITTILIYSGFYSYL